MNPSRIPSPQRPSSSRLAGSSDWEDSESPAYAAGSIEAEGEAGATSDEHYESPVGSDEDPPFEDDDGDGDLLAEDDENQPGYTYLAALEDEVAPAWRVLRNVVLGVSLFLAACFAIGPTAWFFLREPGSDPGAAVAPRGSVVKPSPVASDRPLAATEAGPPGIPAAERVGAAPPSPPATTVGPALPAGKPAQQALASAHASGLATPPPAPIAVGGGAGAVPAGKPAQQALASAHTSGLATPPPAQTIVAGGKGAVPAGTFDALFAKEADGATPLRAAGPDAAIPVAPDIMAAVSSTRASDFGFDAVKPASAGTAGRVVQPEVALPVASGRTRPISPALANPRPPPTAAAAVPRPLLMAHAGRLPTSERVQSAGSRPVYQAGPARGAPAASLVTAPAVHAPPAPVLPIGQAAAPAFRVATGSAASAILGLTEPVAVLAPTRPAGVARASAAAKLPVGTPISWPALRGTAPGPAGRPAAPQRVGPGASTPAMLAPVPPTAPLLRPKQRAAAPVSARPHAVQAVPASVARNLPAAAAVAPSPTGRNPLQAFSEWLPVGSPVMLARADAPIPRAALAATADRTPMLARWVPDRPVASAWVSLGQRAMNGPVLSGWAGRNRLASMPAANALPVRPVPRGGDPLRAAAAVAASPVTGLVLTASPAGAAQRDVAVAATGSIVRAASPGRSRALHVRPAPAAGIGALPVATGAREKPASLPVRSRAAAPFGPAAHAALVRPPSPVVIPPSPADTIHAAAAVIVRSAATASSIGLALAGTNPSPIASAVAGPRPSIASETAALPPRQELPPAAASTALPDARTPRARPNDAVPAPAGAARARWTAPAAKAVKSEAAAREPRPVRKRAAPATAAVKRSPEVRPPRAVERRTAPAKRAAEASSRERRAPAANRSAGARTAAKPAALPPKVAVQPTRPVRALSQPPRRSAEPPAAGAAPSLPASLLPTRPARAN